MVKEMWPKLQLEKRQCGNNQNTGKKNVAKGGSLERANVMITRTWETEML
jgi:hypothetical protein